MKRKLSGSTFLMLICLFLMGYWAYSYSQQAEAGYFPYLLLLLCPLMHVFMHRGHDQ